MKIYLNEIIVSSISTGGSHGDERLVENVSLNFRKFKVHYTSQTGKGAAGASPTFGWDIPANKEWG